MSNSETLPCFYDANGNLINIGPWDYKTSTDIDGSIVVCNPLPEGATSKEMPVITNTDGSRSVAT